MGRVVLLLLIACVCVGLSACNREYKTFTDNDGRFSVEYPRTWEIKPGGQTGIAVTFESPMEGLSDDFLENFSVSAGGIPETMTSEEFARVSMEAPRSYIPKFRILEEGRVTGKHHDAYGVTYEGDLAGEKFVWRQVFFAKKGMGCSIIFTLSSKKVNLYGKTMDEVVSSFRLK